MKLFLKVFSLVLLIVLLAGCAGRSTPTLPAEKTPTRVVTPGPTAIAPTATIDFDEAASHLQGVKVTFLHPWMGQMNDTLEELIAEFNRTNEWGITVTAIAPGSASALSDTLNAGLQESSLPDMIAAPISELLALNKNSETVVDLAPFVDSKTYGLDLQAQAGYLPVFWNQDVVDGFRFGIPAQRNTKVMVYNTTWATELGFSQPPQNADDFLTQVCAANAVMKLDKDSSNDGLGGWIIDTDALTMASWAAAFGSDLGATGKATFNTPRTIATLTYLSNMLTKGCAWVSLNPAPYNYFASRQTLVYSADLQDLLRQQAAMKRAGNADAWTVLAFPGSGDPALLAEGASYAILASAPEKRLAAWLFIRFMTSDDAQGSLLKASVTLPLSDRAIPYAVELQDTLPQWVDVVNLLPAAVVPPSTPAWMEARVVWEDASWQLFKTNMTASQVPDLVKQMDATLKELTGNPQ